MRETLKKWASAEVDLRLHEEGAEAALKAFEDIKQHMRRDVSERMLEQFEQASDKLAKANDLVEKTKETYDNLSTEIHKFLDEHNEITGLEIYPRSSNSGGLMLRRNEETRELITNASL